MSLTVCVFFVLGLVLLAGGAELFVRGAVRIAALFGISPLVIGLTVVGLGTSAPEIAVGVQSSAIGQSDLALGNVVGSNIANILLILGASAVLVPLTVSQQLIRLDVPVMITAGGLVLVLGLDGTLSQADGVLLVSGGMAYTVFLIAKSRQEGRAVQEMYAHEFGPPARVSAWQWFVHGGLIIVGLALLSVGANWLVDSAVAVAYTFGISELVVGLTVVAIGTSLPEVATSIVASIRGERDIAVGNVIGSCIFNLLVVLGLASVVAPQGITVASAALWFDIPVMLAVMLACLPIFVSGNAIARWEGWLFLGYYIAYTVYLILKATHHRLLPTFSTMMLVFVIPLTVITFCIVTWRTLRVARGQVQIRS
jgi:cation:H+ antiporter